MKIEHYNHFIEAMKAVSKEVHIEIASEDFKVLKTGGYNLCFAKKVGDTFNVVWHSNYKYLRFDTFSWTPLYQLFGSNTFAGGVTVHAATENRNCNLGQTCTLDSYGELSLAKDGGSSTALTFNNEYGPIHTGVNQLLTTASGQKSLPIYVSEAQEVVGNVELTPKESVMVWFEKNIETSTMFSTARSNSIEIDMTQVNSSKVLYKDGKWILQ
ncbi:hypothetical protein [Vibrio gazogenes]|uniref:Uncharacterized protein n=1 Tax=Vibrio gazogenes DSM 21264 = NBRC 103151 TaxID=1123492 RepID=A0A1M5EHP3_VIBGA|nr:hypothetical protein [Vibrio gazogenes]USP12511.1 hypothetical protein MKS89_08560 [Vibrio gazogenes]SHF78562.1 hypothetical protein SAMN02745781_03147 [Vibrio gazogenes DSM 21264] [Vibrio gazogenes DSM 21264 = NBRC 103151]SJN53967.1 hypothetical protein BQ6471_00741 [Vibrio gazogenes]